MLLQKLIYPIILGPAPLFLFSFHMVFWGPFWHSVDSSVGRDEACTNFAQLRRIKNGGVDIILGRSNMLNMQVALNFPYNNISRCKIWLNLDPIHFIRWKLDKVWDQKHEEKNNLKR